MVLLGNRCNRISETSLKWDCSARVSDIAKAIVAVK